MAVVDKGFREWFAAFKEANPALNGVNGFNKPISDACQFAFTAGRNCERADAAALITQAAEDKRIADAVRGAWAINCGACKGRGWTDEGEPEIGSAIMDCDVCNGCGKVKAIPASVLEGE